MRKSGFSNKTFEYFKLAKKNKNNLKWFEKNRELYLDAVRAPFGEVIDHLRKELQKDLPGIEINPKSITRPLKPKNRVSEGGGVVKGSTHITLWEKRTSLFEWNPAIHIQISSDKDENFVGIGLYMVSGRQLSLLRNAVTDDFEEIDAILSDRRLVKAWGHLDGEKYKRFPKGFNPEEPRNVYLWHKQFFLSKSISQADFKSKDFAKNLVRDLKIALPFFTWVRAQVGVYRKNR